MKKTISILITFFIIIGIIGFYGNVNTAERQDKVSISSDDSSHSEFYLNPSHQMEALFITEHSPSLFFPSEFSFTDNITLLHIFSFTDLPYKPPLFI